MAQFKTHMIQICFLFVKIHREDGKQGNYKCVCCYRYFLFLFLLLAFNVLSGQTNMTFSISDRVMVSGKSHLPFWLWANQDGKIDPNASFLNLTEVSTDGATFLNEGNGARISYGTSLVGGLEKESYLQLNKLFAAIDYKGWKLHAGMYYDEKVLEGLSSTNGNLVRSRNFRPYPRIGLGTDGFKELPFFSNWLRFKFEYDEGILNDSRYVDRTHLHHKSVYFQILPDNSWVIEAGLEHFVMWGGTSQNDQIGELPSDFKSYLRYITGSNGNSDFVVTDQQNVAGNQYGTYQLQVTKNWTSGYLSLYLSHPFEDLSGMNWRNYPDNMLGVHWHRSVSNAFLTDFLYEFTDTRQQGILDSLYIWNETQSEWQIKSPDNYFNNGVYRSGQTYHKMAMCSPLAPVRVDDGISTGFSANRFVSHHLGMQGMLTNGLYWKTLFTATRYLGNYSDPYIPEKNQVSGLLEFSCKSQKLPFDVMLSFAFDSGTLYENALGLQLGISKQW